MALAFFDLDRTILSVNSGSLWIRRELALGRISPRQALQAAAWLARYHLGLADAEVMVELAISQIAGTQADALVRRTRDFYELVVRDAVRPGALEALQRHRAAGEACVMLTSSSAYLAELVAPALGIDSVLANRFEVDAAGRHTGRSDGRVCFGAGKLVHAQAEADRQGVALRDCAFYTDSFSDLSVLDAVGRPVAVNPDPRLKRIAARRGWPVVDWGVPGPTRRAS